MPEETNKVVPACRLSLDSSQPICFHLKLELDPSLLISIQSEYCTVPLRTLVDQTESSVTGKRRCYTHTYAIMSSNNNNNSNSFLTSSRCGLAALTPLDPSANIKGVLYNLEKHQIANKLQNPKKKLLEDGSSGMEVFKVSKVGSIHSIILFGVDLECKRERERGRETQCSIEAIAPP